MKRWLVLALCVMLCGSACADSFRCGRKLVTVGDSANVLLKKCGAPVRKYSAREILSSSSGQQAVGVSNWVYQRKGRKDMIVSVRGGAVVGMRLD